MKSLTVLPFAGFHAMITTGFNDQFTIWGRLPYQVIGAGIDGRRFA
jgi:hypothetical protein